MEKEEAIEVLQTINEMYPRFNLTKRKAKMLIPNLIQMDFPGVMKNLSQHIMDHPYPPTLSEIAAYPDEEDTLFSDIEQWGEEARLVDPEVREKFKEQFEHLIEQMKGGGI